MGEVTDGCAMRAVTLGPLHSEEASMSRSGPPPDFRRRRRRGRHHSDSPPPEVVDEALLSDEERGLAEARRAAEYKVQLWGRIARLAIVAVPFLVLIPWIGLLIVLIGGIPIARRAYRIYYEPKLRERFIDEEVAKRVRSSVHAERRNLEGEHARSLEKLSASIAHEIRNPITAAKSLVQQMGEEPGSPENAEYARVALGELERVERSIAHLLRFAREEEMRSAELALAEVLDSALETFRERAVREGVEIVRELDCEGRMVGDPEKLRRVVINLVGNAMDSVAETKPSSPRIEASLGENLAGNEVWLRIRDNGRGLAPEDRERIFSPFVTSKEHGTGLGLAISRKLVEAHGGRIEAASCEGGGAEFVITFPKQGLRAGVRGGHQT